jgi:hypothetical protein
MARVHDAKGHVTFARNTISHPDRWTSFAIIVSVITLMICPQSQLV